MKLLCHAFIIMFFFVYRVHYELMWMWVCVRFFHPRYVYVVAQNFIDSLCRQSVDIGYYYYFGFVLYMACCELISIGYFFCCWFAHLFLIHAHFDDVCICACVCMRVSAPFCSSLSVDYHLSVVENSLRAISSRENNNTTNVEHFFYALASAHTQKLPLPFVKYVSFCRTDFQFYCDKVKEYWIWVLRTVFGLVCYWNCNRMSKLNFRSTL